MFWGYCKLKTERGELQNFFFKRSQVIFSLNVFRDLSPFCSITLKTQQRKIQKARKIRMWKSDRVIRKKEILTYNQ
jgi:hypothetical protein